MSRFLMLTIFAGLLGTATGFAEERNSSIPAPAAPPKANNAGLWNQKAAHLDHLRRAVEHLEAAGLSELAAKVEEHAETAVLRAELAQKQSELAKINDDIQRLERLLNSGKHSPRQTLRKQVMTRIKVVEVDLSKLRKAGLRFGADGLGGVLFDDVAEDSDQKLKQRLLKDEAVINLLSWLDENGFAKVVAEPVLATMSGRPASFFAGGQVPIIERNGDDYAVNYRNVGTHIELLPMVLDGGKIRLEVRPTVSRVVPATFTDELESADKLDVNDYESRTFDTKIELQTGQTVAIGGVTESNKSKGGKQKWSSKEEAPNPQPTESSQGKEYIFLITPEIVEPAGKNLLPEFIEPKLAPHALPLPSKN